MNHSKSLTVLIIIILLLVSGCGDDDCPTCTDNSQTAIAVGSVFLGVNALQVNGKVIGGNGNIPEIDSIRVDGIKAKLQFTSSTNAITYSLNEASTRAAGDTVDVEFFAYSAVSSVRVKLLIWSDAIKLVSGFQAYDSGATAVFVWNKIPNVDWYNIKCNFSYHDITGIEVGWTHSYIKTVDDTILTIPGEDLSFNGILWMQLESGTGIDPSTSSGNLTGGSVRGYVSSIASIYGYGMPIGSGSTSMPTANQSEVFENNNEQLLQEMLERFME